MINPNSIASDTLEQDAPTATGLNDLGAVLSKLGGRAKNSHTLQAALALGASSAQRAMRLAAELQQYVEKHVPGTSYLLELRNARTLRVVAETEQPLQTEDLIFEKDIHEL